MFRRNLRHWSLSAAVALLATSPTSGAGQRGLNKSVFVSIFDDSGRPLTDITIDDILIREDVADRQVVAVKPPSQPISVAVLIDTAQGKRVTDAYGTAEEYTRDLRVAASAFVKQLRAHSPDAEVSLMEFGQAAITMVPYTPRHRLAEPGTERRTEPRGPGEGQSRIRGVARAALGGVGPARRVEEFEARSRPQRLREVQRRPA
jgi:hypothetical protein